MPVRLRLHVGEPCLRDSRVNGHRLKPGHASTATAEAPLWVLIDCKGRNIEAVTFRLWNFLQLAPVALTRSDSAGYTFFACWNRRHTLIAVLLTFLVALGPV